VGIEPDIHPQVLSWSLEDGDRLLVYSDGMLEQENAEGEEFGERRFVTQAARAFTSGDRLARRLPEVLDAWRGRTPQQDDMTFMALSIGEPVSGGFEPAH
jgi:sigma-B regulation protein RsbU (phosphoserine phosphatase)